MQAIVTRLTALGRPRLAALSAAGAVLLGTLLVGLNAALAPSYAPLYSGLDPASANGMVGALEQAGFQVAISSDGSVLSVPHEDAARARMALADAGLLSDGMPGWELFDGGGGMGMTGFLQKVNRLRALEGELARSIQTIDGIASARVHLVLPEREAFSRHRTEPSASVIVRSRPGATVGRRRAVAIRALVASAVPDLQASRITVLSSSGETILGPDDAEDRSLESRGGAMEERLASKILAIVGARVGAGNARVHVNVDLTATRQVVRSEAFDPDGRVLRSSETRAETTRDRRPGAEAVGTAGNLPPPFEAEAGPGESSETDRTDEVLNYEIGSTLTETVSEPGEVRRVSVALIVDGLYETSADGTTAFSPRPAEELERLSALVRAAIGYDAARGDAVTVESMRFAEPEPLDAGAPNGVASELLRSALPSALRGLFALAVVLAVLLLGVRPALRALRDARASPGSDAGDAAASLEGEALAAQVAGSVPALSSDAEATATDDGVERARALARERRADAASTLRGWVAEGRA